MISRSLALPLLLTLGACAATPLADPQSDQQAKQFLRPEGDRGAVYIYRSGLYGLARPLDVGITNGVNARLPYNSFLRVDGPSGPIEVGCAAGDYRSSTQVEVVPGRVTFVEASMTFGNGFNPHCNVTEVSPDQGETAVRSSKRVAAQ